jgi:hypothetical protein
MALLSASRNTSINKLQFIVWRLLLVTILYLLLCIYWLSDLCSIEREAIRAKTHWMPWTFPLLPSYATTCLWSDTGNMKAFCYGLKVRQRRVSSHLRKDVFILYIHVTAHPNRFLFNNQPDALINQIYSVINLYMFRASSLPIMRRSLLYIRHW